MQCIKCHKKIPPEILVFNPRNCDCGGELVPINSSDSFLDQIELDKYPYPIAVTLNNLKENNSTFLERIFVIKDFYEIVVKYIFILEISLSIFKKTLTDEIKENILKDIARPSLGHWVKVASKILHHNRIMEEKNNEEGIFQIYPFFFEFNGLNKKKAHKSLQLFKEINQFVEFRNDVIGHGAKRREADYEKLYNEWLEKVQNMLPLLDHLSNFKLVYVSNNKTQYFHGTSLKYFEKGSFFVDIGEKLVRLEPFLFVNTCKDCNTAQLFIYDSDKNYGSKEPEINALEYSGGHKHPFGSPIEGLEQIFGPELMRSVFRSVYQKFIEIDGRVLRFDHIIQKHSNIVGRKFILDSLENFFHSNSSGVFYLIAPPGMGKTAFSAYLIENNYVNDHFFYQRTSTNRSPDDFIFSVYNSLLLEYGIVDEHNDDLSKTTMKLKNLLFNISTMCSQHKKRCVILIDALDEASLNREKVSSIKAIPIDLPDHIYIIATTRPTKELDEVRGLSNHQFFSLQPSDEENKKDVLTYIEQELVGASLEIKDKILQLSNGNFLLLKLLTTSYRDGEIQTSELMSDDYLKVGEINDFYKRSFEGIRQKAGDSRKDLNLIIDILILLSITRGPVREEFIMSVLNLKAGDWLWARHHLYQFFDIIVEEDLYYYRLFHETFREYLVKEFGTYQITMHGQIANYYQCESPLEIIDPYGERYLGYHLGMAGRDQEVKDWMKISVLEGNKKAQHNVLLTLDDFLRDGTKVKGESLNTLLLDFLKNECHVQGIALYFQYLLRNMPAPLANAAQFLYSEEESWYSLLYRMITLFHVTNNFLGVLLFSKGIFQKETNLRENIILLNSFNSLRMANKRIKREDDNELFKMVDQLLNYSEAGKSISELRNKLAHGQLMNEDELEILYTKLVKDLDLYIKGMQFLAKYELLEVIDINDNLTKVQVLQGNSEGSFNTKWIKKWDDKHCDLGSIYFYRKGELPLKLSPLLLREKQEENQKDKFFMMEIEEKNLRRYIDYDNSEVKSIRFS